MIRLVVAKGCRPTGALLERMLLDKGVGVNGANPTAVVSYGVRLNTHLPALNAMAGGRTKYEELVSLGDAGVLVPWTCLARDVHAAWGHLPVLGRRFHHHGGLDIRLVRTPKMLEEWSRKRDFFVEYVESDEEYRVQVYRTAHLGTYRKVLKRPGQQHRVGRNRRNGYGFELLPAARVPRDSVAAAIKAVGALELDFGAVDILHGRNGKYYTLEVNTAPGGEDGRQWLNSLVGHIAAWERNEYPARKEAR